MQTLYYSENDPLIVKCSQWLKWRRTDLIYRRTVESVAVFCFAQNPQHLQRGSFVHLSLNNDRIHNSKKYSSSLPCHGLWDVQTSIWAFWRVQERETWYADNIRAESRHYKILQIQASLSFEVLPKLQKNTTVYIEILENMTFHIWKLCQDYVTLWMKKSDFICCRRLVSSHCDHIVQNTQYLF